MRKFLTFQSELTPKGVHRLRISAIALSPPKTKSTVDLNDQCTGAVRETIEQTIEDLRRTGTTTLKGCS